MPDELGLVHVITGEGKGKTTAAVGLAVRAAGQGLKILMIQFFKMDEDESGEMNLIRERIPEIELIRSNVRHPIFTGLATNMEELKASLNDTFDLAMQKVTETHHDLLILDELNNAMGPGWVSADKVLHFLNTKPKDLEVIITGRHAPEIILGRADYISKIDFLKHPYNHGIGARKGIEY